MADEFVEKLLGGTDTWRQLDQGSYLFHQGDPVCFVFVIERGLIELTRCQKDGGSIVLQRATDRTMLAEASVYSEHYHCDAVTKSRSTIYQIPKSAFLDDIQKSQVFSVLWATHLAQEMQSARYRSEILALKTVAERLDGWLVWQGGKTPAKGQWKSVALQIGVSPEALYRELAKRRPG